MGSSFRYGGFVLLMVIVVICAGCMQPATQSGPTISERYQDVTAQEARSLKHASEGKLVVIDLSSNYGEGHLPMAITIPLNTLPEKILTLDKSRPYLVYCHSDNTSIAGATMLVNAGFSPVYRLKDNYDSWVSAGFPAD